MLPRLSLLPLIVFSVAGIAMGQSNHFTGLVHSSLPPFDFRVHVDSKHEGLAAGFSAIDRIEIRSAGRQVQTINFAGEDTPIIDGPWRESISLRDVDCDGYKDLLVRVTVGAHGDAWYHLYRFDKSSGIFLAYPQFSRLPLQKVDCHNKLITTYVNSGAAGCVYESGTYRWVKGELLPVRIESQEVTEGGFNRIVRSWTNGKETDLNQRIEEDDCHQTK